MQEGAGTEPFRYVLRGDTSAMRLQRHLRDLPVTVEPWELSPGGDKERKVNPRGDPLEEIYLVLRGNVEMTVDGVTHQLRPGDAVIELPYPNRHTGSVILATSPRSCS